MKLNKFKKIINELVLENCLTFGNDPKDTSKRVTRYLLGTRGTTEIFKLYELRSLLLRVYPLIHNLFYNPRLSSEVETKTYKTPNPYHIRKPRPPLGHGPRPWRGSIGESKPWTKIVSFWKTRAKTLPPQILFATVTVDLADIIQSAAHICNMPFHKNRWWNGSITASASTPQGSAPEDSLVWNYLNDFTQRKTNYYYQGKWGTNKENPQKTKEKIWYYGRSRWPSLLVVPDISKNTMILTEAKKRGLPIIGLVNSDCTLEIDYPIFAQDQTVENVYFFCHFLATLIAKEMVYIQHKRYTLQQSTNKNANKKRTPVKKPMFSGLTKVGEGQKRQLRFDKLGKLKPNAEYRKKTFFFKMLQPQQEVFSSSEIPFLKSIYRNFRKKEKYKNYRLKMNYVKLLRIIFRYCNSRQPLLPSAFLSFNSKGVKKKDKVGSFLTNYIFFRTLFFKEQNFLYRLRLPQNLVRRETKQKYFCHKIKCFWTTKEKKNTWNRILTFLRVKKMIKTKIAKKKYLSHNDAGNNHYYWLALHQWFQDVKWQSQAYLDLKAFKKRSTPYWCAPYWCPPYETILLDWLQSARKWKQREAEFLKQGKDPRKYDQFNAYKSRKSNFKQKKFKKRNGKKRTNYTH